MGGYTDFRTPVAVYVDRATDTVTGVLAYVDVLSPVLVVLVAVAVFMAVARKAAHAS